MLLPPPPARTRPALRLVRPPATAPVTLFLTLCAAVRDPVFGWVTGGAFLPSPLGRLVRESWLSLPLRYPRCGLDAFALLPDHVHALVHLGPGPARAGLGAMVTAFKQAVTLAARADGIVGPAPLWQRGYFEREVRDAQMLAAVRDYIVHQALREARCGTRPRREPRG